MEQKGPYLYQNPRNRTEKQDAKMYRAMILLACLLGLGHTALAGDDEGESSIAYFSLTPSLVSNLTGGPKYIRADVQIMTRKADRLPELELHAPAIRDALLMLLIGADGKQLLTRDGKEALRTQALEAVRKVLEEKTGDPLAEQLYFTSYYVK